MRNTHPGAGLQGHATEAREHTGLFTLQYTAGHDNIKTTMRYVHPQADAVNMLFARHAEVVKLADTPS
jgi:hypothetical protein